VRNAQGYLCHAVDFCNLHGSDISSLEMRDRRAPLLILRAVPQIRDTFSALALHIPADARVIVSEVVVVPAAGSLEGLLPFWGRWRTEDVRKYDPSVCHCQPQSAVPPCLLASVLSVNRQEL